MFKKVVSPLVVSLSLLGSSFAFWQEATPGQSGPDRDRGKSDRGQASSVRAPSPVGGPSGFSTWGGSTSTVTLLRTPEVRTELKLEEDKAKKLDEISAENARERARLIAELNAKIAELNKKAEAEALALLNEAQRRRTEQLRLQQQGLRALSTNPVAEKLGLSQAQRDEIAKLYERGSRFGSGRDRDRTTNPPNSNVPTAERFRQSVEESNKRAAETRERILAVLTPEQKAKWSELTGEPFQFPSRSRSSSRGTSTRSSEPAQPDAEKKDQ